MSTNTSSTSPTSETSNPVPTSSLPRPSSPNQSDPSANHILTFGASSLQHAKGSDEPQPSMKESKKRPASPDSEEVQEPPTKRHCLQLTLEDQDASEATTPRDLAKKGLEDKQLWSLAVRQMKLMMPPQQSPQTVESKTSGEQGVKSKPKAQRIEAKAKKPKKTVAKAKVVKEKKKPAKEKKRKATKKSSVVVAETSGTGSGNAVVVQKVDSPPKYRIIRLGPPTT